MFSTFITGKLLQTVVDNSSSETETYEADGPLPLKYKHTEGSELFFNVLQTLETRENRNEAKVLCVEQMENEK